jgi:predicted dehydrogenase
VIALGFVGLGWWGRELARAASALRPRLRVARCFSPIENERGDFAREFGAQPCASLDALLAAPDVDAVILATPHSLHGSQIEAAAGARKHVFVEKPMTLAAADGRRALAACRARGVTLAVGHNRRLLAGPAHIRQAIAAGRLGTVLHAEANFSTPEGLRLDDRHWRARAAESPGGALAPLGIHVIDMFHFLFGEVERVSAMTARRTMTTELDDTAAVLLRFRSGVTGYFGSLYATPYTSEFTVYGSAGKASLHATRPDAPEDRPTLDLQPVDGSPERIPVPWVDTTRRQLECFADAIEGKGAVAVDGEDALRNVALLEAILASAASGGRPETPDYRGDF